MGRTLAYLGGAQSRLQALDDDFYVRGVLAEGRYRSLRVKTRAGDRPPARRGRRRDQAANRPCTEIPVRFWEGADFQRRRDLVALMIRRVEVMPWTAGPPPVRRVSGANLRSALQPGTTSYPARVRISGVTLG